jgi:hypothetical protein
VLSLKSPRYIAATLRKVTCSSVGLAFIAATQLASADQTQLEGCPASNLEQARVVADRLFEQAAYQRAGECYRLAGDYDRANSAFAKATRVSAATGSRQLAEDRDQAKAQWQRLQAALHHMH